MCAVQEYLWSAANHAASKEKALPREDAAGLINLTQGWEESAGVTMIAQGRKEQINI